MSKEREALNIIVRNKGLNGIKEPVEIIEKALEIIKNKSVDVSCLLFDGLEVYNENMHPSRVLAQEEFDLLKEVLL